MAKVGLQFVYNIPPDQIWARIGKFNALPVWHTAIRSSRQEDDDQARRLSLLDGGEIVERLETLDEKERIYRYSAVNRQLPIANYTATLQVCDAGADRAVVDWSSEFEPTPAI